MEYPKLRHIEAFPVTHRGQKLVALRDPLNLIDKVFFVPYPTFLIISMFDGQHSLVDIQAEFMRRYGQLLFRDQIQKLIEELDEQYLLDSPRFAEYKRRMEAEFRADPVRRAIHAGVSYAADPDVLRQELDSYFNCEDGAEPPKLKSATDSLKAAIAPHIDFRRGGYCYTWAYKEVAENCRADLFIIFGTCHAPINNLFALTRKDYQTPFGLVETDREFVDALARNCSTDFFSDEFAHRAEHSIEFQVVFLHYLFDQQRKFKIVPILCGSFHESVLEGRSPLDDPQLSEFMAALRKAISESRSRICMIAGADLAHVGPRFGDPFQTDQVVLQNIAYEDKQMLQHVVNLDPEGFHRSIAKDQDKRRICGYPPIYTMLLALSAREGRLLKYGQRVDDGSAVTFASITFY